MKDIPLIDELRAARQRLAEEQQLDVDRYARMLRDVAQTSPGHYLLLKLAFFSWTLKSLTWKRDARRGSIVAITNPANANQSPSRRP